MALDPAVLASLRAQIQAVPDQGDVYDAELATRTTKPKIPDVSTERLIVSAPDGTITIQNEKPPEEHAIDGVAWHVFNSLRGAEDTVNGATFADIRAILVEP